MQLPELIDKASEVVGSQRKLAEVLGLSAGNLTDMKKGRRPCNLRLRAKLAETAGYDLKTAVIEFRPVRISQ